MYIIEKKNSRHLPASLVEVAGVPQVRIQAVRQALDDDRYVRPLEQFQHVRLVQRVYPAQRLIG